MSEAPPPEPAEASLLTAPPPFHPAGGGLQG